MIDADDPRHGTNPGYIAGCRDACCRVAHARNRKQYRDRVYLTRGPQTTDGLGTRRRIQALMALGWSTREIDKQLGKAPTYTYKVLNGHGPIFVSTARIYADIYDRLCMTPPTSDDPNLAAVIRRNRKEAARRGYAAPLMWDDIDDPNEVPSLEAWAPRNLFNHRSGNDYDEAAVVRVLVCGDWRTPTTTAERREVVRRWSGELAELARLTGWKVDRYITREDVPA